MEIGFELQASCRLD